MHMADRAIQTRNAEPMTRELRTSIAPGGPFDRLARMEDVRTIGRKTQQSGDGQVIASIPAKSRETGKRRLCNLPLPCRGEIFCVIILYLRQAASWHGRARYGAVPPRRCVLPNRGALRGPPSST